MYYVIGSYVPSLHRESTDSSNRVVNCILMYCNYVKFNLAICTVCDRLGVLNCAYISIHLH